MKSFRLLLAIVLLSGFTGFVFSQSANALYNTGNIPTNFSTYSGACNGPLTTLTVIIPAGMNVTSVSVTYDMIALNGAWMSEQNSQIHCQETGITEAVFTGTGGNLAGTETYNRAGVTIANGISATGILTFEMRAWRSWGGTLCDNAYQYINNNTWTVTVFYNNSVPSPTASPGGVSSANLTSWFKSSDQLYQNAGMTIPVVDGSNALAWGNMATNAQLPSVSKIGGGTITYTAVDDYFNYNSTMQLTSSAFISNVSGFSDIFLGSGTSYYSVFAKGGMDLVYTFTSASTVSPCGSNRCCTGFRGGGSQVTNVGVPYGVGIDNTKAHFSGSTADFSTIGQNNTNGILGTNSPGTFNTTSGTYSYNIFNFPGYNGTGRFSENFTFDKSFSTNETSRVESYLAIKYGITLGTNGTSKDYLNSTSTVVWTQSANSAFAYDIAGVSRDDNSALDQRKSHSVNNTALVFDDILVVVNGNNFNSPTAIATDRSAFVWGHNGQPATHTGWPILALPTDNGEIIETIFQRKWKSQESGTLGSVTLEFDLSSVPGVGNVPGANDLSNLRLLVDEDGDFTNGATAIAPSSFSNVTDIAYFIHDFIPTDGNNGTPFRGFFFTLGSIDATTTPLPVTITKFDVSNSNCQTTINWTTESEENSKEFIVECTGDLVDWREVCRVPSVGNSNSQIFYECHDDYFENHGTIYYRLKQVDNDGVETIYDMRSVAGQQCDQVEPIIYPNPTEGIVNIDSPLAGSAVITDATGKLIFKGLLNSGVNTIDLGQIASGIYIVSIQLNNGSLRMLRFIKD
ncbi:MAG: hypothetical protein COA38_15210 [Fluviicola sp.]|nr:MAG: hypothetical protein COA38_15210 [Fluviicola sp.]